MKQQLELARSTLSWQVRGAGVEPSSVDVLSTLGAATAYLELLQGVAELRRTKLHFTSMRLGEELLVLEFQVDEPAVARTASSDAQEYLEGRKLAPRRIKSYLEQVQRALDRLPANHTIRVSMSDFEAEIARQAKEHHAPPAEVLELRAVVMRVGGHPARVAVVNDVEGLFTLALSQEQAAAIAHWLYREVDVSAEVSRDEDGKIADGTVLAFSGLEHAEGQVEADIWRQWFSAAGAGWNDVDDIEAELGRSHGVGSP